MKYLTNAYSLNMAPASHTATVSPCELDEVRAALRTPDMIQGIGHANTAAIIADMLGLPVHAARVTINLQAGDVVYVAQYTGPRLDEGATQLPEGASISFRKVVIS